MMTITMAPYTARYHCCRKRSTSGRNVRSTAPMIDPGRLPMPPITSIIASICERSAAYTSGLIYCMSDA